MGWNKKKDPIVLESSAPWDDGGRKYNVIYLIAGILGAILWMKGSLESKEGGSVIFIFCLIMGWLVKNCIVDWIWRDLRKLRFRLEMPIPYDELIEKLIPRLLPLGMSIEKDTKGRPIVKYKRIIFDIFYTDNNTAFCMLLIPLRRSRLSGKTETICPDRRKPLNLLLCAAKPHVCYCA